MDELELIKEKINIVDLIQEYLPLKKSGANFKANCPFHLEKSPSFIVSPARGIWHCFGCQKGGDIFKFLMEKEGVEFKESLEILAKRAGVTLKREKGFSDKRERLYEANSKAAEFFHYILTTHPLGKKALEYLKSRGIEDQTIKEFQLGYSPNSWDSLTGFLTKRGFKIGELIEAGLAIPSKSGGYDRFRGRVMFPLLDTKSLVVGFAGRVLEKQEPKYINTSQTPIFDKSHFLFGLNLAKGEIRAKNFVILTEGEMDMILSYQSGVKNVVASKGTALTSGQIDILKKHTDTILLCFDMDLAGDSASRRGIELADAAGLNIKVIQIAEGKDPAELAQKDPQLWAQAVEKAEPIYDYYLRSVMERYKQSLAPVGTKQSLPGEAGKGRSAEDKKKIAAELLPIWAKITDSVTLEHYLQKLSALISVPEDVLRIEIKKSSLAQTSDYKDLVVSPTRSLVADHKTRRELLEEYILSLLLKIPSELTFVPNFPETVFVLEQHRTIYVLLVLYLDAISFKAKAFNITEFVKTLSEDLVPLVDQLYLKEIDEKLNSGEHWQQEVKLVVSELKRALVKASLEKLSSEIKSAQLFGKIEQLENLNRKFRDLSLKLKTF